MNAPWRFALASFALGTIAFSAGCARFSKGSGSSSAVVAYKVERLTFISTAGQRCEVDAVTYSIVKPGEVFHCNWGGAQSAAQTVSTPAPKALEPTDPNKPESQSPWWWPFKKSGSSTKTKK